MTKLRPIEKLIESEQRAFEQGRGVWVAWRRAYNEARGTKGISASVEAANDAVRCPGCGKDRSNIGPWNNPGDPPRLCGACKISRSFTRPGFKEKLERSIQLAYAAVGFGNVKGEA